MGDIRYLIKLDLSGKGLLRPLISLGSQILAVEFFKSFYKV